ncbi:hypothetical protein [Streptomyces sp. NPDC001635]
MRFLSRRPRPAALLAAGLATAALGVVACFTSTYDGRNAGATIGTPGCFVGVEWRGDPGVFTSCDGTDPDATPRPTRTATIVGSEDTVTAYNDGRADAMGDDNRDGRVDEDESGWECHTMGNRVCGTDGTETAPVAAPECELPNAAADVIRLCLTVAAQPAYGWTNPDGSRVDNPAGRALVADLEEEPGTPEWATALRALHADYLEHAPRH